MAGNSVSNYLAPANAKTYTAVIQGDADVLCTVQALLERVKSPTSHSHYLKLQVLDKLEDLKAVIDRNMIIIEPDIEIHKVELAAAWLGSIEGSFEVTYEKEHYNSLCEFVDCHICNGVGLIPGEGHDDEYPAEMANHWKKAYVSTGSYTNTLTQDMYPISCPSCAGAGYNITLVA